MSIDLLIKSLEERIKRSDFYIKEFKDKDFLSGSDWYEGYQQAFREVLKVLQKN